MTRSVRQEFLDDFLTAIAALLSSETAAKMKQSLELPSEPGGFHAVKADAGRIALDSFLRIADRLAFIRSLELPRTLLSNLGRPWIDLVRRRVWSEKASEMRRHPERLCLGMYAVFLITREQEIVDGLVHLLIETIH